MLVEERVCHKGRRQTCWSFINEERGIKAFREKQEDHSQVLEVEAGSGELREGSDHADGGLSFNSLPVWTMSVSLIGSEGLKNNW